MGEGTGDGEGEGDGEGDGDGDGEGDLLPAKPSLPYRNFQAILCVKWYTRAKTTACVAATTNLEPPLGRRRRTPGVRRKKRAAVNKLM